MKTILINPPQENRYPQPPLGLASIAAVLEQKGHQVEILDANALQLSGHEIVQQVKNADAICITAMTPAVNSAITIAKEIKGEIPESTIILGGPHATILPEDTLNKVREIDIIVIVVGGGVLLGKLERLIRDLRLEDGVILTGFQPYGMMPKYINLAELCINPFRINDTIRDIMPGKILQ